MAYLVTVLQTNAIVNGVYDVTFSIFNNYISPTYTALVAEYGEPTITVGGTYTPSAPVPAFTLPVQILNITSDLPITFPFDPANPALSSLYAEEQAKYFACEFVVAFNTAVMTLASNIDTFSGQSLSNFPNTSIATMTCANIS